MKTRIAESRTVGLIFMIPLYIACTGVASAQTRNDTLQQEHDAVGNAAKGAYGYGRGE